MLSRTSSAERTSHSWLSLRLPLLLLFLLLFLCPDLALLIPPIRLKTLSNIPISLNQPKSVSPPTLLLALINCTNDLAPLPAASTPSSLPDALTLQNISSLPAWISVLFKPPLLSNMSLWRFPSSCSPEEIEEIEKEENKNGYSLVATFNKEKYNKLTQLTPQSFPKVAQELSISL